jgi:PBSX family phage terminase large subunit
MKRIIAFLIILAAAVATVSYTLIQPHQTAFVNSNARYLLNSGGVGSGKTYSVVLRSMRLMLEYPGIKGVIGAQTMPMLRDTTMAEFEAIVPRGLISVHNKATNTYTFKNGSQVLFRPFDDPNKFKSLNVGFVGIEEMTDVKEEIFKMLRTRLRQKGVMHSLFGATNPGPFTSWVYRNFIEKPIEGSDFVYSISRDNPYLPEDYLTDLETLRVTNPEYYARMVEGRWGALEGLIYNLPREQRVDSAILPDSFDEIIAGLDFGHDHPTALVVIGIKGPYIYLIDEYYKRHLTTTDIINIAKEYTRTYGLSNIYCDTARPEIIKDLQNAGIPARDAVKDVFEGIIYVQGWVNSGRLIVCNNCIYSLREFDSYIWDKGSTVREQPIKLNDDAMDAIRYAVFTHLRNNVKIPRITTKGVEYVKKDSSLSVDEAVARLKFANMIRRA